jgi:phosphoribosyl 1,2-cyclic phosphodiesterase
MSLRLMSIASGSSGNCIYVGNEDKHILIDTGISKKRVELGLKTINLTPSEISGIFITHEHSDHTQGLGVISRKYNIPIYGTAKTIHEIKNNPKLGEMDSSLFKVISPDTPMDLNGLKINPFSISHDAADPVAYRMESGDKAVAVATDMGYFTDYTVKNLLGLNGILLESNHDIRMLQTGSYPYYLKQRILSNKGHLCNEMAGRLLDLILNDNMKKIFLGHLSKENNYDKLAFESVRMEINLSDSKYMADDFDISVAKRDEPSLLVEF